MTNGTKDFPTLGVVTCTTGRVASQMDDVYEVLNHVLSDNLFTHQLPRASDAATPLLVKQFPWLDGLELPAGSGADFAEACARIIDEHGPTLPVKSAAAMNAEAMWVAGNALRDLGDMAGETAKVIVMDMRGDDDA